MTSIPQVGRRIPVPPSPCISRLDGVGWQDPPLAVRVGSYDLGLRGSSPAAHEFARAVAGDRVVDAEGETMPRNLSVYVAEAVSDEQPSRDLHRLYLGHHLALRSRDLRRLAGTLDSYLDAHARTHDDERAQLCATVLVRDGEAHVFPIGHRAVAVLRDRSLRDLGYGLIDRPWVEIDLSTGDAVVPTGVDVDSLAASVASARDPAEPVVGPGRYPVTAVARPVSRTLAAEVVRLARGVVNLAELDAESTLLGIRELVASAGTAEWPLLDRIG